MERRVNEVWTASFSLPADDLKNALCTHFNYVEIIAPESGRYLGLYRIMPAERARAVETDRVAYQLEHVITTLLDDVIDGLLPALINRTTRDNLQRLLNLQTTQNWRLGTVEFERYFQYSFENENGLLAPVLSIPQPFDDAYEFTYDTTTYPWTLNLVKRADTVMSEIRWGKDMISFAEVSDPSEIVNHLIPKGYGEGVNQLTIEKVNGGRRFLQNNASIAQWGRKPYIWIDRRFKDAKALKESGESLLRQWKDPKIAFEIDSIDLSILPEYAHEQKFLNGVTRIVVDDRVYHGRILEERIADISKEYEVSYQIANRISDIATIQADIERKQQVNEAYSQGATNILAFSYQDNADSNVGGRVAFYIDDDVVNVNSCELTFRLRPFRAYSRATLGGGAIVESTKGGGGTSTSTTSGGGTTRSTTSGGSSTQTSSSGGGTSTSTQSGGGTSQTSSAGGNHRHRMFTYTGNVGSIGQVRGYEASPMPDGSGVGALFMGGYAGDVYTAGSSGNHNHTISVPAHTHSVSTPNHTHTINIPNHSHDVTIPAHSHDVTIPNHSHEIELPDHTHDVKHEIVELNSTPSRVAITVDGNTVPHTSSSGSRINIVDYLEKDDEGRIRRGQHEVLITPNGLARVEADLILRVFITSQLGVTL